MVQIDVEKVSEYRIGNSGALMPAGDKQQPVSAKKSNVRELPYEIQNIMKPRVNSISKDRGLVSDVAMAQSNKRPYASCLTEPSCSLPPGCIGPNGIRVYVRRNLGSKACKIAEGDTTHSSDPMSSVKTSYDGSREPGVQLQPTQTSPSETAPDPPISLNMGEPSVVASPMEITEAILPELDPSVTANSVDLPSSASRQPNVQCELLQESEVSSSEIAPAPPSPLSTSAGEPSFVLLLGKPVEEIQPKSDHSITLNISTYPVSRKDSSDGSRDLDIQHEPVQVAKVSPLNVSPETSLPEPNHSVTVNIADPPGSTKDSSDESKELGLPSFMKAISDEDMELDAQFEPTQEIKVSPSETATQTVISETNHSVAANFADPPSSTNVSSDENMELEIEPPQETKVSPSETATQTVLPEKNHFVAANSADPPSSIKASRDVNTELKVEPAHKTKGSPSEIAPATPDSVNALLGPSLMFSLGKPTEIVLAEPSHTDGTNAVAVPPSPPRSSNQDWKERFLRLQMFLKQCDQSNQEEYIQRLRSLPTAGRNRHAVELEKRAMRLAMEEANEYQRMRSMGILGKSSSAGINLNFDQFS